jgi:hypothetical protein
MNCHGCGAEVKVEGRVGRAEVCDSCGRPLRCCKNCQLYAPTAHNKCHEPQSEWVPDREAANFCDYFTPAAGENFDVAADKAGQARKKLDDLFR